MVACSNTGIHHSYENKHNPENWGRTAGGNQASSSCIGEGKGKGKRQELPRMDNGYTLRQSPSDEVRSPRGATYADAVKHSRPFVQKCHSWW